ncbi:MAG: insulinase family protein [Deltaproteobacteria bacterium]|nr:insulinase family protein [Deltaproteobacteria bacterium]
MLAPLLLATLAASPALPERVLPAPIRVERLPSGLSVAMVPFPAGGVVAFDVRVRAGAREEQAVTGVAHLVEHLLFKGTARLPEAQLKQKLQSLAVDANGETDHDYTLFSDVAPAASLPALIELEADRVEHLQINSDSVASEAGAVRSEAEARAADPEARLGWALEAAAFPHHPYGRRPIGTGEDLRNLHAAASAARAFYAKHYRPDATLLVLAGDFDPDEALARIKQAWGGWKGKAVDEPVPPEPASSAEVRTALEERGAPPVERVGFRVPPARAHGTAAALLLAELLGGPLSALHKKLVLERDVADRVDAEAPRRRDEALFCVALVGQKPGSLGELEQALDEELRGLREGKLDAEQLERARRAVLWGAVSRLETPAQVAREIAIDSAATGDARATEWLYSDVATVDVAGVTAYARAYLVPERRATARLEAPEARP